MEITMPFAVFLLICSLCTAEPQTESDNEIIPHEERPEPQGGEPTNASDYQTSCQQDIHAVLREMSVLLAEQRMEIRFLQRENEEQTAKLKELESQKAELDNLKEQLTVKQVAFSASLLASGAGNVGPFNVQVPLVFKNVITNIGNAYNQNTGHFIAPVRGAYHFEFYIYAQGHASYTSGAVLVKNGQNVCIAHEHQPSHRAKSSNGVTLLLEVGDVVALHLWVNLWIYDTDHHHTTFSGHLLFSM